ncbi:MAG: hypothetical protein ACFB8W_16030 [Elainellaceae cyanobacterium]
MEFVLPQGKAIAQFIFGAYFALLAIQILAEYLTLRKFQSVAFVMVPYLYVPYRLWQLYEGLGLAAPQSEIVWIRWILICELVLWGTSHLLDIAQLPRLFLWPGTVKSAADGQTPP